MNKEAIQLFTYNGRKTQLSQVCKRAGITLHECDNSVSRRLEGPTSQNFPIVSQNTVDSLCITTTKIH